MARAVSTAVVTGASSGIGAAYARRLAADGYDLVLVARRADRLQALADRIQAQWHVRAAVIAADLAEARQVELLCQQLAEMGDVYFLVNAAGFVTAGTFASVLIGQHQSMLRLHAETPMRLCRAVLPGMLARCDGAIVNVASIGGLLPSGGNVTYSATKAFLVAFTQALNDEVRASGVRVQTLCPGFTRTGIYDRDDLRPLNIASQVPGWLWMSAEEVVDASLRALVRNQVVCVPGWRNRLLVLLGRLGLQPLFSRFAMQVSGANRRLPSGGTAHG